MEILFRDLKYTIRMLRKNPGLTLVAVLSIALGIGANTTIFTWVKAVLLHPLPGVVAPEQLVDICGTSRQTTGLAVSYLDFVDYRDQNMVFSGVLAYRMVPFSLSRVGKAERLWGNIVSGNYFEVLGVKPVLGRTFLPEEDQTKNTHPVVVLSYGLWQSRFAASPTIVGQSISLNGENFTVIGVTPKEFMGTYNGLDCQAWVPMMMQEKVFPSPSALTGRGARWLNLMARLKPGVTLEQAQANLTTLSHQLGQSDPGNNAWYTGTVYKPTQSPNGPERRLQPVFVILMVIVGLVLLIACANVANLLLARATNRRKEIGIRLAMGASRGRLIRQLMTESLVLAILGGLGALFITFWTADIFQSLIPPLGIPVKFDNRLDGRVFGFTLIVTLVTGFLFGMVPALQASKPDLISTLKDEAGSLAGSQRKATLRNLLVMLQVALSTVALISAGLFIRSLMNAQTAKPGFDPDHVVLATFDVFLSGYDEVKGPQFFQHLLERVALLPGVQSACLGRRMPLSIRGVSSSKISIEGYTPGKDEELDVTYEVVSPKYFQTLTIPMVAGRDFDQKDTHDSTDVAIVNETMAHRYWPSQEVIGKRISTGDGWTQVVGVVKDVKYRSLTEPPQPYLYFPMSQSYRATMTLAVRTSADTKTTLNAIQSAVAAVDPNIPVFDVQTMNEQIGVSFFAQRMAAILLSFFGLLALFLASVGLYGVMTHSVSQRTHEIGIRMALGAATTDVVKLVLGQEMMVVGIGVVLGLGVALATTRFFSSLLYGVSSADLLTYLVVSGVLVVVAILATLLPTRKALKVNPLVALRYE